MKLPERNTSSNSAQQEHFETTHVMPCLTPLSPSSSLLPAGDVQPGQTQPAQSGGDQHHLLGAVAASQPGLHHPD